MGICHNSCKSKSSRKNSLNKLNKSNLEKFKKNFYNEATSSIFKSTADSSSKQNQNYSPEIYTLNKFGIQVKTKQKITQPLKFIFHLYDFKCKMLTENTLYILQIIFDGKEFPLSYGKGNNPSFFLTKHLEKK